MYRPNNPISNPQLPSHVRQHGRNLLVHARGHVLKLCRNWSLRLSIFIDNSASSLYWMNIEYNLGLVAGSVACLRPFFVNIGLATPGHAGSAGECIGCDEPTNTYKLRRIGGGPKWRRSGPRGAASRVQGESILNSIMKVGMACEDEPGAELDHRSCQGSTDQIIRPLEKQNL